MTSEWNHFALGEITELVIDYRGKTPKKLGGDWCKQGYRALSAKNIKTGRIVQAETIRYIDESLYRKWMKDEVQRGDILITSEAPFGQIFFWDSDEKIVLSQRLFCVRIKPEYDARFIYYYMTTPEFQSELDGRATGTTVIGLRQPELMKCVIRCPEIQEQKVIAAILSSIDAKIIANEKVNDNLLDQAQTLYKQHFPYSVQDDLPDGWRIGTVGEIIEIHDSKRIPLSGADRMKMEKKIYPYYGAASLMDYVDNYIFDGKYLLLGEDGTVVDDAGYPILQYVWGQFWVNNHAHILTGRLGFNVESLYMLFKQTPVKSIVTGAVQPKISQANLRSVQVVIPPERNLKEYNDLVEPLFSLLRANEEECKSLAALRDTLLPKLMSGEIDVSTVQL